MTQAQCGQVIATLQERGIANPSYGRNEFTLYRSGGRHLCLKERNPLLVFYGPDYQIMRGWADRVIDAFATTNFPDWECCRRENSDPDGDMAVWFQFKAKDFSGDWFNNRDTVINVAVALYNKLQEEGIYSETFNAENYREVHTVVKQGVIVMNANTKNAFEKWMSESGLTDDKGKQYSSHIVQHIAKGRSVNVLDDQGQLVENLDSLILDLEQNYKNWDHFSQDIQGTPGSKADYKVALNKFIDFAKSAKNGLPPLSDPKTNEQQKGPEDMKQRNRIVFGAPGTGKSHELDKQVRERFVDGDGDNRHKRYERVTFYPTYSYAQFVGTYKPVMEEFEVAPEDDILSEDELANRLKTASDDAKVKGIDQTAAVIRFAVKYYNSIKKVNQTQMFNKSGLPNTYKTYLTKGLSFASIQLSARKKETAIVYKFVPGPFLRVLVTALNNPETNWCLVIEEINRANAAAVFGDVFQLLDRKDGVSEYAIAVSEDVKKYLLGEKGLNETGKNALRALNESLDSLKIPANMYIWATMNSADQGVFPMDTAFKRRWAFEYLGLNEGAGEDGEGDWKIGTKDAKFDYKWEDFRRYVNRLLALAKVNEDKLMGPFFMKKPEHGVIDKNEFESKVLMYLWEDAGKMCRRQLFGEITTYSELIDEWEEKGIEIFSSALREKDTIKHKGNNFRNAKTLFSKFVQHAAEGQGTN